MEVIFSTKFVLGTFESILTALGCSNYTSLFAVCLHKWNVLNQLITVTCCYSDFACHAVFVAGCG